MDILESKSLIIEEVNKIINSYHLNENKHSNEIKSFTNEVQRLNKLNQTLSSEIASKDKLLCINEQKTIDYENMINQIQEDALKETTEKERFDMLKAQDKEIHLRDQEIIRLQKRVDDLENKLKNNSNERLEVDKQLWKMQSKNSYFDDNYADWQTAADVCTEQVTPYTSGSNINLLDIKHNDNTIQIHLNIKDEPYLKNYRGKRWFNRRCRRQFI